MSIITQCQTVVVPSKEISDRIETCISIYSTHFSLTFSSVFLQANLGVVIHPRAPQTCHPPWQSLTIVLWSSHTIITHCSSFSLKDTHSLHLGNNTITSIKSTVNEQRFVLCYIRYIFFINKMFIGLK